MSWPRPVATAVDVALDATVVPSFSRIGFEARRALWGWTAAPARSLSGEVAVVTGATSGLGRTLSERLAAAGAAVVVVGRDAERTEATRAAVIAATGNEAVSAACADLGRLDDVRALAEHVRSTRDRLDLLVHNAGALTHHHVRTADGFELTVQTHVVAPFLLTHALRGLLESTPGARVQIVSSGGMYTRALADLDVGPAGYDGVRTYALAKRAQVVLNEQWAARHPKVARFDAMHPGWVDTPGLAGALPGFHHRMGRWLRTPEQGVDTLLWLAATRPEATGRFWFDRRVRPTSKVPWTRSTAADAERQWDWVSEAAGTAGGAGAPEGAIGGRADSI